MTAKRGRHFLQIPGPSNVPDRVLRAIAAPTIDHRGPEFAALGTEVLAGIRRIFMTRHPVVIYPGSGTGGWEAALVNTLSPGDTVLMFETGHFATLWRDVAQRLGFQVQWVEGNWRHGVDPADVFARLSDDRAHAIKAVCVVHNETSTGCTSRIDEVRAADPHVKVLVHPETPFEVVRNADLVGSTEYIIEQVRRAPAGTHWAIGTEIHLVHRLALEHPEQRIHSLQRNVCPCATMNRIDPAHLLWALENLAEGVVVNPVRVPADVKRDARIALDRMLALKGTGAVGAPTLTD